MDVMTFCIKLMNVADLKSGKTEKFHRLDSKLWKADILSWSALVFESFKRATNTRETTVNSMHWRMNVKGRNSKSEFKSRIIVNLNDFI